ncbi:MAG TPA: thiamine diphosphokinase [Oscillospiraceae bacterium]|nr:thiamine diphosphokinase [Oscillospiraceae bacterium]
MKKCSIFSASEIKDYSVVDTVNIGYIICADGGLKHVEKLGLTPNVLIGDFDTASPDGYGSYEIIKYPCEKDDTDTMLAAKLAAERGYNEVAIYGGIGGRIDHTFANIQTLNFLKEKGIIAELIGDNEVMTILKDEEKTFPRKDGFYFSVFSYSEKSSGVFLEGVKYPLTDAVVYNSFPIGVSNEILVDYCTVKVKKGTLLIVFSRKSSPF